METNPRARRKVKRAGNGEDQSNTQDCLAIYLVRLCSSSLLSKVGFDDLRYWRDQVTLRSSLKSRDLKFRKYTVTIMFSR
jgi:hypothetical protein